MADQPLPTAGAAQIANQAILAGIGAVDDGPEAEYAALGQRIGELIENLEANPDPAVGSQLEELLAGFDGLHRDALQRLAGLLAHHRLLDHALTDPVVAMVLDLYDLGADHRGGGPAAVIASRTTAPAAEPAAPMIRLQDIRRFPAATMPVSAAAAAAGPQALENVLAAPDSVAASAQPPPTPPPTAPPASTTPPRSSAASSRQAAPPSDESGTVIPAAGPPEWTTLFAAGHAPAGTVVPSANGEVLVCNVDGVLHALRNRCGGTPLPLHFGEISDGRLVCPWHRGCGYDLLTGESTSGRRTVVYPVRLGGEQIVVALNHGRSTGPLQPTGLRAAPM